MPPEVWIEVTPLFVGWMRRRVQTALSVRGGDSDDIGRAIACYHDARDLSGVCEVDPPAGWTPPGYGVVPPPDWDTPPNIVFEKNWRDRPAGKVSSEVASPKNWGTEMENQDAE